MTRSEPVWPPTGSPGAMSTRTVKAGVRAGNPDMVYSGRMRYKLGMGLVDRDNEGKKERRYDHCIGTYKWVQEMSREAIISIKEVTPYSDGTGELIFC